MYKRFCVWILNIVYSVFFKTHPVLCLNVVLTLLEAAACSDYDMVVMQVAVRGSKEPIIIVQNALKVIMGFGTS